MDLEGPPEGRLGELLSAAAAPGRPHELAAEDAAVAGFRAAYRPAVRHRRRRLFALAVAGVAAVSIGGTAFAATTGHLPAPVQAWLGGEETPPVHTSPTATPDRPRTTPGASTAPGPPSTPTPTSTSTPTSAAVPPVEACQAFLAFRADPHAPPVTGEQRKELNRLSGGGEKAIQEYCNRLLGVAPTPTMTPTPEEPAHEEPATTPTPEKKAKPSHANKQSGLV
ncbi:hypothetical protein ABT297_27140 [Dactylosporangium sp. NPDC000555]|uniref:hypothetical protein n=1 Tax=Dactylosporangium sp. NPDC000555 TaxID=3154260 RepID=UPI003333E244